MKQHISTKQLNELSEKPFLELEKWKIGRGYGGFPYKEKGEWQGDTLSIGQMIEFLGDEWAWHAREVGTCPDNKALHPKYLCNALYQAVKEVLEE